MRKAFTSFFYISVLSEIQRKNHFKFSIIGIFLMLSMGNFSAFGQSGSVFRDFNANGTKDTNEPLVSGVLVKAYNSGGALCASATSAGTTSPNYTLPTTCTGQVRVEFEVPATNTNIGGPIASYDFSSYSGTTYGSAVQFVAAGAANTNFGINNPSDYCQSNPYIATVCYVAGNPLAAGYPTNGGPNDALVTTRYNLTSTVNHDTKFSAIGATWGVSYNRLTKKMFTSAFVKRHSGLGPLGPGGIYVTDYSGGDPATVTPTQTSLIDLAAAGINVGTIPSNVARGLKGSSVIATMDSTAWFGVGKIGLGDLDISDDFNSLYTVSLASKKIIKIDLTGFNQTGTKPTAANVSTLPDFPNPTCTNGQSRPFALKYRKGKLYLGVICDASVAGGTRANLTATVYVFDETTNAWSVAVAAFPLDYKRGPVHKLACEYWIPWTDDVTKVVTSQGPSFNGRCFPQPILSDIEFDVDGSMILGFADRGAHMMGGDQPLINNKNLLVNGVNGGDILRVYNNNGSYVLENNGTTLGGGGAGVNNEGPGTGEYYRDNYIDHNNTSLGGLAILPGKNEIVTTTIDPIRFESAGFRVNSNTTGQEVRGLELYYTPDMRGTFGKGAGLGDIELLCDVPPLEIGNRVWNDTDKDGIQDAGENGIANVSVELFADFNNDGTPDGAALATTPTSATGTWYFNDSNVADGDPATAGTQKGLAPNKNYLIRVGSADWTSGAGAGDLAGLSLTTANATSTGLADVSDSDAALSNNIPTIAYKTGDYGQNNHTLDMGFTTPIPYGSIGDYVWTDANNDGQQAGEAPIKDVKVYLLDGSTGAKLDSAFTDVNGKYLFDSLSTGAYKVKFVAPTGTIAAKQNTGTSTQDVSDSDANKFGFSQIINIDTSKLPADTLRNNPQVDAGFVPVGSIGDYVFEDLDKSNTQTAGDMPLSGVKVYLLDATTGAKIDSTTTDANGLYLLDSLVAGNYKVQFVAPTGTLLVSKAIGGNPAKDSNADPITGITDTVNIDTTKPINDPARDNRDVDAGIKLIPAYGSIGDFVWTDVNNNGQYDGAEAPIKDVKVYLYDATGTTKLDSTLTDGAGKYLFDSLLTGSYKVKFIAPAGTFPAKQNIGADVTDSDANELGFSQIVKIDVTKATTDTLRNNPQIDAGFVPFGSIGDYVFNDKDNSNTQTTGDLPVEGVKVYLLNATSGAKLDSTVTNAAGLYKFDSLIAGNYKVQVVVPTGMTTVTKDSGDDTKDSDIDATGTTGTYTVDITKPISDPARNITTADAGIKGNPQYGSIGDYVWFDVNNNGQQDGAEAAIKDVKVYLYDAAGTTILDSTLTDASGKYLFDSLLTGGYKVKFVAPVGTFSAKQNTGADVSDSDANKLGFSQVINIDVTKLATDTLRNNPQIDAGFVPFGSIGDYVFEDKDDSNTQTAGDLPVSGVKVYLLDATTGAKLDSAITDGTGKYLFDSLVANNYKVQFVAPAGSLLVTKKSGTDVSKDSNPDPTTGITDAITIDTTKPLNDPARDNRDVDAGIKAAPQFGSIGDYVWTDTNSNGQQDAGEAPIKDVKVYLYDATGVTKLDSTLTNAAGKYLFDSLITSSYKVRFIAPTGTIAAKQNTGADVSDSDANKLGFSQVIKIDASLAATDTLRNNPQIDAGFVPVGSIGDYVFNDKDNSDTQTAGDSPIEGVKVYLLNATTGAKIDSTTTDAAGLYKFDSLVAGNYKVRIVVPTGMSPVLKDSGDDTKDSDIDPTGTTSTITLDTTKPIGDPLRDITSVDAGLKGIPQYGSIGDYVWLDTNNNGQQDGSEVPIKDVKVYLYNASGTTILDSALTDNFGKYLFDSLLTGAYKVKFVAPKGTIPAKQNTGTILNDVSDSDANKLGFSQVVNIDVTKLASDTLRNNPQIDAGFVPFGSLGDYVFNDKDNSNTQTAGDSPIPCIRVYLLDGTTGAILDSTMTDISGKYLFDSLLAGNYKVKFVAPIGGSFVTPISGGDVTKDSNPDATGTSGVVIIDPTQAIGSPARDNRDLDAGLKIVGPFGSIGDYVWSDVNNNGQQDGGEAPIKDVKVYLYDATGTMIMDSTLTDAAGKYLFDSLFTADYRVKFVAPAGTIPAMQNKGADVSDSDANKLGFSHIIKIDVTKLATDTLRNNPHIDAGFVPVGSIGDYVFEDKDNSNTQTAGDLPIQGVKVYLLDATTGAKLDSTITDGTGKYLFDSLVAKNYKIQFIAPNGTELVTKASGTNIGKDSNADPITGITDAVTIDTTKPIGDPARDNRDVDAGIKASLAYGSIGDYVWTDNNNNGQQDAGEAPIKDVKIYLYDASGTTKLDSALTDGAGKYLFDSLLTGSYKIKFIAPAGTIAAKQNTGADVSDSDANKLGFSQIIKIDVTKAETDTLRNNPQIDAGFVPVGSIGDYVFNDKDNSNTQTMGDLPIEGVKVYLLNATTGAKLDSTTTNAAGLYKFDSLVAGNYKVQVVVPTGMTTVTKDSGDDTKDSDIDATGTTGIIAVNTTAPVGDPLRDITSVDAGLKGNPAYGSIGDYVWTDQNNNGQQDAGEAAIKDVKVYLYNAAGTVKLDSTLTDAAGKYLFDSLATGSYKVKFVAPTGTIPAKQNTGADASDSDANKLGFSQIVNIDVTKLATDTLRNNPQIDAGFVPVGSIGDYVFNDKDNSNTQTVGDLPIQGVKVYLLDATTGVKLDSTTTDGTGKYLFDSLVAKTYKVQFIAPLGTNLVTKTAGTDVSKDSNPDPATGITDAVTIDTTKPIGDPARDNRDVDAGVKGKPQYGSIGDYVWLDANNNGQQDAGEAPIKDVKVYLYDAAGLVKIDSALTNGAGKYLFDSLLTGGYKVKFVAPIGTIAAKQNTGADVSDSDANKAGFSQIVNIDVLKAETDTLRNNPQIDAGFVPVGSIGDYVFTDKDNSNTQSAGDLPVSGVKVYLLDALTGAKLDSTLTDMNGLYKFDNLLAGNYTVQFVTPVGTSIITKDSGTDDTKDSDADTTTGITAIINVDTTKPLGDPARNVTSVDAGLKPFKVDLSLKKTVDGNCKRKVGDTVVFKIIIKREDTTITDVSTAVRDSLSANLQFVNAIASEGTYNNTTGIWNNISLAKGDSATLTITAKIKIGALGLVCNDAWISFMDKDDFDSIAGNKLESEDDFARACVSVAIPLCSAKNEKVQIAAPAGYSTYQWYKNGQIINGATSQTYLANAFGEYSVTVDAGSCPANACCPIYVEDVCDCPPVICVPFTIQKTNSKK